LPALPADPAADLRATRPCARTGPQSTGCSTAGR